MNDLNIHSVLKINVKSQTRTMDDEKYNYTCLRITCQNRDGNGVTQFDINLYSEHGQTDIPIITTTDSD